MTTAIILRKTEPVLPMMRTLFFSSFLFFFLIGCVQNLQNTVASGKNSTGVSGTAPPVAADMPARVAAAPRADKDSRTVAGEQSPPQCPAPSPAASDTESPVTATPDVNRAETAAVGEKPAGMVKKVPSDLDEALDFCQVAQDFWQKGELDNALESLDQAYSLILKVDTDNKPRLTQEKEDLRFMISKRILEIYASRNIVVNGHHNAIPLDLNRHVQAEIDSFISNRKEKGFFVRSYERSGQYRPYIVEALRKAGLPEELSWLPLIESGFVTNALSRARALGLWQFISSTGYKFGLKRNMYIDERLDPVKSTQAAIAYLKELHQIFGDWTTVLAAYNCGEGRVLRVIRSQNINYLDNFWDFYEKLPRETARYVPRFLATLHILKNPAKYGLDRAQPLPPLAYETVKVSRKVHLKDIARATGISEKELKSLNPELRYSIIPGDGYALRVPPQTGEKLLAGLDKIPEYQRPVRSYGYYTVRRGDTLSSIAKRHRTSVAKLMRANNLGKSHYIVAGKRLKIPQLSAVPSMIKSVKPLDLKTASHVVKRGDSLWIIARRYGTTTQKIQSANGLRNTKLHIGQVLKIPGRTVTKPLTAAANARTYCVKQGDSPFRIARTHNMPLEKFLRINRLTPRSRIYPGQELYVD